MMPGMSTSLPSEMTSTSSSVPGIYLSTSTGFSMPPESIVRIYFSVWARFRDMVMFWPPITYDGRRSTG